jgi:manganese transport protein
VIGSAIALNLLFHIPLFYGVLITGLDVLLILLLQRWGFRYIEALVIALIGTILGMFSVQVFLSRPQYGPLLHSLFIPSPSIVTNPAMLYIAIGILGATVMPHNLYLHSSIVQTRHVTSDKTSRRDAILLATLDTVVTLLLALLVNAAILILAASAFHATGHRDVTEIQDAYRLLDPVVGATGASLLFGIALLASGQSSTFTGTIAGQIIMEGFLDLKIPCWQRRLITRAIAVVPAFVAIAWLGERAIGMLIVLSQVVLSLQLPFAIWPLIRLTRDRRVMGPFASGPILAGVAYLLFALITVANGWLVWSFFAA